MTCNYTSVIKSNAYHIVSVSFIGNSFNVKQTIPTIIPVYNSIMVLRTD